MNTAEMHEARRGSRVRAPIGAGLATGLASCLAVALVALVAMTGGACDYDPPPDVVSFSCEDNRCVVGEPIVLRFSEAVKPSSVAIRVWPGAKNSYDLEGNRLDTVTPVLESCAVADSPCGSGDGVTLTLDDDGAALSIDVTAGALGPLNRPLVLEVDGALEDDDGRRLKVSRSFDFQMVGERWDPFADTVGGDDGGATDDVVRTEPLGVNEGPHLFFAVLAVPGLNIDLAQQFFTDLQVDQLTGEYIAIMTDSDPVDGAPLNTDDPDELFLDLGIEGFVFLVHGTIRSTPDGLAFDSEPFTLELSIGPITFALRDSEIRGSITEDPDTGLTRWDGTMAVRELLLDLPSGEQIHENRQDNFQLVALTPEQVPDGMPLACSDDPCVDLEGPQCTVPVGEPDYPPAAICPDDDAP